jgi:hypothetical protein
VFQLHTLPASDIQQFFAELIRVGRETRPNPAYLDHYRMRVRDRDNLLYNLCADPVVGPMMDLTFTGTYWPSIKVGKRTIWHESQLMEPSELATFLFNKAPGMAHMEISFGVTSCTLQQLFLMRVVLAARVVEKDPAWFKYTVEDFKNNLRSDWVHVEDRLARYALPVGKTFDIELSADTKL